MNSVEVGMILYWQNVLRRETFWDDCIINEHATQTKASKLRLWKRRVFGLYCEIIRNMQIHVHKHNQKPTKEVVFHNVRIDDPVWDIHIINWKRVFWILDKETKKNNVFALWYESKYQLMINAMVNTHHSYLLRPIYPNAMRSDFKADTYVPITCHARWWLPMGNG